MTITNANNRKDFAVISDMIPKNARVLDIGCGSGDLLQRLTDSHNIDGRGLELDQKLVNKAVARGLAVIQGNANTDLHAYTYGIFDFVILSQTIQAMRQPKEALQRLSEIGKHVVVSLPNFGYWRLGLSLLLRGRMPSSAVLPYPWYLTPNIHLCTIADFYALCDACAIEVVRAYAIGASDRIIRLKKHHNYSIRWNNLFNPHAVFLLRKKTAGTFR